MANGDTDLMCLFHFHPQHISHKYLYVHLYYQIISIQKGEIQIIPSYLLDSGLKALKKCLAMLNIECGKLISKKKKRPKQLPLKA